MGEALGFLSMKDSLIHKLCNLSIYPFFHTFLVRKIAGRAALVVAEAEIQESEQNTDRMLTGFYADLVQLAGVRLDRSICP